MSDIKCPKCRSSKTVRIIYGLPTEEAMEKVRRGEFVLGGCVVHPDNPDRECSRCGEQFSTKKKVDVNETQE